MLPKLITILTLATVLAGCRRHHTLSGDHPPELIGTWQLLIRSSCADYGVKSDTWVLRADGTFDQHVVLNDGKRLDLATQHWRYEPSGDGGHIALDKRLEFFTPEHFGVQPGQGVGTFEMLIVDLDSEPVIVLHPDSDCVYSRSSRTAP
jgi:hypothetical protein